MADRTEDRPANALCILPQESNSPPVFLSGPSGNLGLNAMDDSQVNLAFKADGELLAQFGAWFDLIWSRSVALNHEVAAIPALSPAQGSPEAGRQWAQYLEVCEHQPPFAGNSGQTTQVTVDAKTGTVVVPEGTKDLELPTDALKVPKMDDISRQVMRILEKGMLATIDEGSRLPPLDCPVKAEWFDVESLKQVGAVSREIKYRISVLDDKVLKKMDTIRHSTRALLNRLSFPMAEQLRWIPTDAKAILERELEQANQEGQEFLKKTLQGDVGAFVSSRVGQIKKDAQAMYRDFHPKSDVRGSVVAEITTELTRRLEKAASAQLLPKVCYLAMRPGIASETKWASPWGAYLTFLVRLLEFPRKCLTDSFFLRGLKSGVDEIMKALNVGDDRLVQDHFPEHRMHKKAREDLDLIRKVREAKEVEDREKCSALLLLLKGEPYAKILEKVPLADPSQPPASGQRTDDVWNR